MSLVLFLFLFFLLAWIYALYILFLILFSNKKNIKRSSPASYPAVEIIIPCFNEEGLIGARLQNLLDLDYLNNKLHFTFVDGGSTDQTVALIKRTALKNKKIGLIQTNLKNKIKQLNKALSSIKAEIVCISDVDTTLDIKTVRYLAKIFRGNPEIGVVGVHTCPINTILIDQIHWQTQNKARLLESRALSSSSVIANCYAFRKDLLPSFPEDVIADDVHIVFHAQSQGWRVVYTDKPMAFELRSPQTLKSFITHKFRKAHANITETLRFLPKFWQGGWEWKIIYLTKLLQVIGAPFIVFGFLLLSLYFLENPTLPAITVLMLMALIILSSWSLQSGQTIKCSPLKGYSAALLSLILVNLVLFSSLLMYPWYKQTASYRRIG